MPPIVRFDIQMELDLYTNIIKPNLLFTYLADAVTESDNEFS